MILRGIRVENWRCIRRLVLEELPEGIVVLHGPNRTGKSSLVLALRECLFDSDHDSARKEIKESVPWSNAEAPKVVVEFMTQGADYRLTKVFSKKKEGTARLEKKVSGVWKAERDEPKEASRAARDLLGADKSTAGLNRLLWLAQGEVALPEPKELGGPIHQNLMNVLGVMVTGRDATFKKLLDNRCKPLFTETGKTKTGSPVAVWEQRRSEHSLAFDEEHRNLELWKRTLEELQVCKNKIPISEAAGVEARGEVEQAARARELCRDRLARFREAERDVKDAGASLARAEGALERFREAARRHGDATDRRVVAERDLETAARLREDRVRFHEETLRLLDLARRAEHDHRAAGEEIDDRRRLLALSKERVSFEKTLAAVELQERQIEDLQSRLSARTAPEESTLALLRSRGSRAVHLRARLDAANLSMTLTIERPVSIDLSLDRQVESSESLAAGAERTWTFRQRAELAIEGVGKVAVARAQESADMEQAAAELLELDRGFQDAVRAYGEDPRDETCLDRLVQRGIERKFWSDDLKKAQEGLQRSIPDGRGAVEAERDRCKWDLASILERRPDLVDDQPRAEELAELETRHKAISVRLEGDRKRCEADESAALESKATVDEAFQQKRNDVTKALAAEESSRAALAELGDETALVGEVGRAKAALAEADRVLAANVLSNAELSVEERWKQAVAAHEACQLLHRELELELTRLSGFLQGNEGLHTRHADAEAAFIEAESILARERLEAEAYRRLRELFEQSCENQVQQVMGPIAGRVLDWSSRIGLTDVREVCFGDQILPNGLRRGEAEKSVAFGSESYGTGEQLSLLVRLALGGVLSKDEPVVAILDDPLAHADPNKHRRILDVLRIASEGSAALSPPAGRMQIVILTCHPDRFDHLPGAKQVDLAKLIFRV